MVAIQPRAGEPLRFLRAAANFPMALDETGHRLFIGCRKPAKILTYDTSTGKEVGASDIVGDTDDLFYDSARKRLYVSGGDGFIDVLDARDAVALKPVARVSSGAGARTSLFVPDQSRFSGRQVPIDAATKINGRLGGTNFGALVVRSRAVQGLAARGESA
jgi:hypothetical protein